MLEISPRRRPYTLADLPPADRPGLPAHEQAALDFCRRWLAGQPAFGLTTSGSTGAPKPVTLSREAMIASARLTGQALGLQAGHKALVCLSTHYIAGMMMLVRGLELGLSLTVVAPSANPLADLPAAARFDFTALVPMQMAQILGESPEKLPILNRMTAILLGGASVSAALQPQLQAIATPVYHTYGMTETVSHIALKRLNGPQPDTFFRPLPGVRVGLDSRGCLTIAGPPTAGQTIVTNDLARLHPDGAFEWLGRLDNVINSGGVKVQLETVEAALERAMHAVGGKHLAQRRFVVGPQPDARLGQRVVAIIEGRPFSAGERARLETALRQILIPYELPRAFYFLPSLPETPTGKIDRAAALRRVENDR
jgi:O-succinylbenzoic acid--CoA ligase